MQSPEPRLGTRKRAEFSRCGLWHVVHSMCPSNSFNPASLELSKLLRSCFTNIGWFVSGINSSLWQLMQDCWSEPIVPQLTSSPRSSRYTLSVVSASGFPRWSGTTVPKLWQRSKTSWQIKGSSGNVAPKFSLHIEALWWILCGAVASCNSVGMVSCDWTNPALAMSNRQVSDTAVKWTFFVTITPYCWVVTQIPKLQTKQSDRCFIEYQQSHVPTSL